MRSDLLCAVLLFLAVIATPRAVANDWMEPLRHMPLRTEATRLNRANTVTVVLNSLRPDPTVKAVIFMPGATDELYLFKRVRANLTNTAPSLLDAVTALTNQTSIRATFHAPFLLLHSDEDPLSPLFETQDETTAAKVVRRRPKEHILYEDKDWDYVQYDLLKSLKTDVLPGRHRLDTFHFYRHSFAAWHLDGMEYLKAVSLAGKTAFTIEAKQIVFRGDTRFRTLPTLDEPPGDNL